MCGRAALFVVSGSSVRIVFTVRTLDLLNLTFDRFYPNVTSYVRVFAVAILSVVCLSLRCVAQWAKHRSLASELTLSCARPAADG